MNKLKSLLFEENVYTIAIRERKDTLLFENGGKTEKFFTLPITDQSWYADPMVFTYKGKDWLFCEIYDREKDLGTIGVTELTSLHIKPPREVLNIGTHLSYPCVFELDGEIYMIPETTTRKNIVVFHASHFPDRWEQVNELMHGGEWADTTVYATSNITLVLTFEQCQGDGSITKVHVHDGRELPARLIEYPSVKFEYDKQNRGAGNFFEYDNMLIRPSQNCTLDYGHALRFNKVQLFPKYAEDFFGEVKPEEICCNLKKCIIGIHTYCLTNKYEIIDIKFNDTVLKHQVRRVARYFERKLWHR